MFYTTADIVAKANSLVKDHGTRDPFRIADDLGILIKYCKFDRQRGAYKVINRISFIFLNKNLSETEQHIVTLHELGHDRLHKAQAINSGGFQEFQLFDMTNRRMEYEANVFAAQLELDDDEFLDYSERGYDLQQMASAMNSDINLIALKADILISQGYRFRRQEHRNDFLRYDK